MNTTTEIRIDEHGDETHESWVLIRANKISGSGGQRLFDSEVPHQHFIKVEVVRCTRKRDLKRDWLHSGEVLLRLNMSQAQWGGFVSSFGSTGVPATMEFLHGVGNVPGAPAESRFDESHREVRDAGTEALAQVNANFEKVMEAFEAGGKKALREALRSMQSSLNNAPKNMEFAASSLTAHVENVVAKARADIEGMLAAQQGPALEAPASTPAQILSGT